MSLAQHIVQWIIWALLVVATGSGALWLLLEIATARRPFQEGLSRPARRAWRFSGVSLLALTAALTLAFWLQAERSGAYWPREPAMSWALILWLLTLAYRRSRFQLALTPRQLSLLSLTAFVCFAVEAGLLISLLLR